MISKEFLDRVKKIPGEWFLEDEMIRHRQIEDDEGDHACPLVALLWYEQEESWYNESAFEIEFEETTLSNNNDIICAADNATYGRQAAFEDDRKLLMDACRIKD